MDWRDSTSWRPSPRSRPPVGTPPAVEGGSRPSAASASVARGMESTGGCRLSSSSAADTSLAPDVDCELDQVASAFDHRLGVTCQQFNLGLFLVLQQFLLGSIPASRSLGRSAIQLVLKTRGLVVAELLGLHDRLACESTGGLCRLDWISKPHSHANQIRASHWLDDHPIQESLCSQVHRWPIKSKFADDLGGELSRSAAKP